MWHSDWSIQSEGEVTSAIPSRKMRQQVVQHYNIHEEGMEVHYYMVHVQLTIAPELCALNMCTVALNY